MHRVIEIMFKRNWERGRLPGRSSQYLSCEKYIWDESWPLWELQHADQQECQVLFDLPL